MAASKQGSKYSVEQVAGIKDTIVAELEKGHTLSAATLACGQHGLPVVDGSTIWRWRQDDADFEERIRKAQVIGLRAVYDIGHQAILNQIIPNPGSVSATLYIWAMTNIVRALTRAGETVPVKYDDVRKPLAVVDMAERRDVHVTYELVDRRAVEAERSAKALPEPTSASAEAG